jgi:hypothetical protein
LAVRILAEGTSFHIFEVPQYEALIWMTNTEFITLRSNVELVQQFALVPLYMGQVTKRQDSTFVESLLTRGKTMP